MGVSYYTYLGPYVQIHNPPKPTTDEYHSCSNKNCYKHSKQVSSKFCEVCGYPVQLLGFPTTKPIKFDAYSELNERLVPVMYYKPTGYEDYEFLVGNVGWDSGNLRNIRPENIDCGLVEEILPEFIPTELKYFGIAFKKEIDYVINKFGKEHVKVCWGLLNYGH